MILYVVTNSLARYPDDSAFSVKLQLERVAQDVCLIIHYTELTWARLRELNPWAIVHSGGGATWAENPILDHATYKRIITKWDAAQLAICLSHQALAYYYGSRIDNMRALRPDDPDVDFTYRAGQFKENGMYPVTITAPRDPLFRGFDKTLRVRLNHAEEVRNLARCLLPLAHTPDCEVQAFKHRDKPLYGVQFHPEISTDEYPDGRQVLANFFRLAKRYHGRKK